MLEKLHKDNIFHKEDNFENIFNDPDQGHGFQDEHGINHWRDINGLHDGNISPFDVPSSNNIHDTFHTSNYQEFGSNENNLLNSHEHCFENNTVNLDDGSFDVHRIDNPSDNIIENYGVHANDEINHRHLFDNNDHVSFGSYYYTGPNGEKLYKAGDGHTYDINGNKVD